MNTNIRSKGLDLSESMKVHVNDSLSQLEKYNFNINHIDVIITDNHKKGSNQFEVEYLIKVDYKKDVMIVKHNDEDFYALIDVLTSKTEKLMRRLHDKKIDRQHKNKEILLETFDEIDKKEVI